MGPLLGEGLAAQRQDASGAGVFLLFDEWSQRGSRWGGWQIRDHERPLLAIVFQSCDVYSSQIMNYAYEAGDTDGNGGGTREFESEESGDFMILE